MRNLQTKSFVFGDSGVMVTYDDDTLEALSWETKDHNGKFIAGVKLNCVHDFRITVSEKHIFKHSLDGVVVGLNLEDTCEDIYRRYVNDGDIEDSDWAYVNILSAERLEPSVLMEIGSGLRHVYQQRYGGELNVAVGNDDIFNSPANVVIFYADGDNYVIADRKEVMPCSGVWGGGIFAPEHVNNRVHGTIESDMAELSRVLHRMRRNDHIQLVDFSLTDRGVVVTASAESGSIVRTLEVYGDKFKIGNK